MRRRVVTLAVSLLLTLLLGEIGVRTWLGLVSGVPFLHPDALVLQPYPDLATLPTAPPEESELRILVLGASVTTDEWGHIPTELRRQWTTASRQRVRIVNLSAPARTALDALVTYRHVGDARYDLVLLYHGINEVRANNCPRSVFRDDYSHYAWYRHINHLQRHPELRWFAAPWAIDQALQGLADRLDPPDLVPVIDPRPEWVAEGADLKTPPIFGRQVEEILDLGRERGETVVLMTFAHYLAPGYTRPRFAARTLDYGRHGCPVEDWGQPDNVVRALDAHNAEIRRIHEERPGVPFVDQDILIPHGKSCYDDICHLTAEGSRTWVENLRTMAEVR